jgi:hypothetical protein
MTGRGNQVNLIDDVESNDQVLDSLLLDDITGEPLIKVSHAATKFLV